MYRKRPTDSSESSANSSFRSRLKAGEIKAPVTRRPALSSIQPGSGGTSKSSNRPTNAFSFGDDENDTPDEEDMDVTQPQTSQLNQTNNRLQASVTFDRLIEDEDVEAERNEVNPRVVANASTNIRTQAQIHGPRIETGGEDAEGFESNIFQRLKELGVEVKTNDNETYFYLGIGFLF
uniref:Uncharacterized protein n=1 Tax=Panagrolaimus davidi TaxID=227884 RepID=A0A914P2S1_9BILA